VQRLTHRSRCKPWFKEILTGNGIESPFYTDHLFSQATITILDIFRYLRWGRCHHE